MSFIKKFNGLLRKYCGEDASFHWQNLNELPSSTMSNECLGKPWRGRSWLHFGNIKSIGFEWNIFSRFCHSYVKFGPDGDDDVSMSLAVPPLAFWFHINGLLPFMSYDFWEKHNLGYNNRMVGLHIHHWKLWIELFAKDMEWSSSDPWWQKFSVELHPLTLLFGEGEYSSEILKEKIVEVPMPEKTYKANMQLCADSWTRPGFPLLRHTTMRVKADMLEPIPKPGKGTTSYNCGPDTLHGMTCSAETFEEAIGKIVKSVLTDRRRYPL